MSPQGRPAAAVFDPGSAGIPPTLGPVLTDPDTPILLLVAADASDRVLRTVLGLANARAEAGHATLLGDAGVTDPRLHGLLGADNVEGLADLFLFGASLDHVCVRPKDWPFGFVSTGAYVPDPGAVLDSARWDRIADELEETGTLMLLFVPASTPGLGALSRRIERAVLIGSEAEVERAAARLDDRCRVVGVVRPAESTAPARPETTPNVVPPVVPVVPDLSEPPVFRSASVRRRLVSPLLLIALIITIAAGAWFLYDEYLAEAAPDPGVATADAPPPAPTPERGDPVETPIPVSVAVELHPSLESARQRVDTLSRAEPSVRFYLAPFARDENLYYQVLAGPVQDLESGNALMQRLVDAGHKTAFDSWAVRPTELAFHLGEYDTEREAEGRVAELRAEDIPSYVVTIRYEPGPPRYRVYGGAFESAAEAEVMEQMLEEAGIEARLVERTGEPLAGTV